ncbi:hypothetical protein ANO14919_124480 [Xylariales sp. No.14919]|nr:hypothetical protein ANO14919_124480 [Xylariales sp. No.14919]
MRRRCFRAFPEKNPPRPNVLAGWEIFRSDEEVEEEDEVEENELE